MAHDYLNGPLVHRSASPASLGLLRILVFGVWTGYILLDPLYVLAWLPVDAFSAPGILRVIPEKIWPLVLSDVGLRIVRLLTLAGAVVVLLGLVPYLSFALSVTGLLVIYQGVLRGFAGHINHAELLLLSATAIVAVFPCFDALSLRKPRSRTRPQVLYAAPFVVIGILFCVTYSFVGIVRLAKGPELFMSETFRNLILRHWIEVGGISGSAFAPPSTPIAILDATPRSIVQISYVVGTMFEFLAPLALFDKRFRFLFVCFVPTFHFLSAVGLGVVFTENVLLLIVFSQHLAHNAAAKCERGVHALKQKWFAPSPAPCGVPGAATVTAVMPSVRGTGPTVKP